MTGGLGFLIVIALPDLTLRESVNKILQEQKTANELQSKTNNLLEKLIIANGGNPLLENPAPAEGEENPIVEEQPFDRSKFWICRKCKRLNADILDYCSQCGEHK